MPMNCDCNATIIKFLVRTNDNTEEMKPMLQTVN